MSSSDSSSSFSSASSSGDFFNAFIALEEGFYPVSLHVLLLMEREDRVAAFFFKNSLSPDRIRQLCFHFFVSLELEIVLPRRGDSVLHPSASFSTVYIDYFKAVLHIPLLPLHTDLLDHYQFALPQLVPNAIRTVIAFQLYYDYKIFRSSVSLFRRFFC